MALAGCATDNNTLIFGTSTNIGLDVSAAPNQGGAPQLTLGYKRAEGVWMPLREIPATTTPPSDNPAAMYQSQNSGPNGVVSKDAYSVFASIGAKFNGGAQATQAQAGAGLAQFFATGAAAVSVTQNEALVTVLKVSDPQSSRAQAEAVVAASGDLDSALAKLSPDTKQALLLNATQKADEERLAASTAGNCQVNGADAWAQIVARANKDSKDIVTDELAAELAKRSTAADRSKMLIGDTPLRTALTTACDHLKAGT